MVFQTVEIKILKKKVGLNAFLNYCKKDMDNFMIKQISILFLTFHLPSNRAILYTRGVQQSSNSSQTVVRMHFPSHESFRVAEGRIKRLDTNGSIRIERKTPISQAMPGHGARFIRPQENGMPALYTGNTLLP